MMDIDVKKSKMQMFDLVSILRSLLYENKENMVSLGKEIDFLKRFINLEKMRFDDSMEITFVSNCEKSEKQCMPFLFLPLLENSFKHSLNINGNSFIHIEITEEENSVTYKSENTNFPRKKKDGVSGGLGLENFKKRLDLIYADRYEYNVTIEDNVYKVYLKVNL
jgi:LytS/YehU family sensor histidine kinase